MFYQGQKRQTGLKIKVSWHRPQGRIYHMSSRFCFRMCQGPLALGHPASQTEYPFSKNLNFSKIWSKTSIFLTKWNLKRVIAISMVELATLFFDGHDRNIFGLNPHLRHAVASLNISYHHDQRKQQTANPMQFNAIN